MKGVVILREADLPVEAMVDLVRAATTEGHRSVLQFVTRWVDGTERFNGRGEAVFLAWAQSAIVGFASVGRDGEDGALRHLFVHPTRRRRGIGESLVRRVRDDARRSFVSLTLHEPEASTLFARLGFQAVRPGVSSLRLR